MHLSFDFCLISIHLSFARYFLSHWFCILSVSSLILFDSFSVSCFGLDHISTLSKFRSCNKIRIVSQLMFWLQATSGNQLGATTIEIEDGWRIEMYNERVDILYSVKLFGSVSHKIICIQPISLIRFSIFFLTLTSKASKDFQIIHLKKLAKVSL